MKFFHVDTTLLTQNIIALERSGRYEESLRVLGEFWEDKSKPPITEGLSERDSAEVFLRCGSVIGFIGHLKQVPNSQEHSRNLLTTAREFFLRDYDLEKIAECENYIALSYWRKGEKVEADTWIEEALYRKIPNSSQVRLHSYIIRALILLANNAHEKILELLLGLEKDFLEYGDNSLRGDFYNHLGLAKRRLGDNSTALTYLETAKAYHTESGHKSYLASILNNIAFVHKEESRFKKAHEAIDSAIEIFRQTYDRTREGFALDTKALIFSDEGKYPEALETIESSITILGRGENKGYLVDSLQTKVNVLIALDHIGKALQTLFDAVGIAKENINQETADKLMKDFESAIRSRDPLKLRSLHDEKEGGGAIRDLELTLPKSIARTGEFHGINIKNDNLSEFGLIKGHLAIAIEGEINKGDLIAAIDKEDDLAICGIYDTDFGIICIETPNAEPQLFNSNEIEILGKIVGYCDPRKPKKGKLQVIPVNSK